jgi:hypothetical protein
VAAIPLVAVETATGTTGSDGLAVFTFSADIDAIELGLVSAAISNPFASADPNILQLLAYLKSGGRKLAKERAWSHLTNEYTFSTASGTAVYALPSDYRGMIDQSGWNRTSEYPLGGPLSPQEWQYAKAVSVVGSLSTLVRFQGGQLEIIPTPSATETIALEYLTTSWIRPVGQTTPTSDLPSVATDVVCFDPALVVSMLKLEFLKNKGFDTTSAQQDFDRLRAQVASEDSPSPVLSLNGNGFGFQLLNELNIPQTGVGQ